MAICQLAAPFAPYVTEEIYRNLTNDVSVHLSTFPEVNNALLDLKVEERMDLIRDLVKLGRGARETVKIKVRQPIQQVVVDGKYEALISDLVPLVQEELNVKEMLFTTELSEYMNFSLKPNFKVLGPQLGNKIGLFGKKLAELNPAEAAPALENGATLTVDLDGEAFEVNKENVLISISSKEGFTVSLENNVFVILDTTLSEELIQEGYAREMISRIQQMRKAADFKVLDHIRVHYECEDAFEKGVQAFVEHIKEETLTDELVKGGTVAFEEFELNGCLVKLFVEKI